MKPEQQRNAFLEFMIQNGVERFDLSARAWNDGKQIMKLSSQDADAGQVFKSMGWAGFENRNGADIFIRPSRHDPWPVVFIDDINERGRALQKKYRSISVETSPGNFQAWIVVDRQLSEAERKNVQTALIRRLNGKSMGGDLASRSGDHNGRLPGFRNHKPGRGGCWCNLKAVSDGILLPSCELIGEGRDLDEVPLAASALKSLPSEGVVHSPHSGSDRDESAKEWGYVMARLGARTESTQKLIDDLAARAFSRGKGSPAQCRKYAAFTVRKAEAAFRK